MNLPKDPETPPQINIVPLIDVVFSLLTFFVLSSLFLTNSEGLPVNLPTATSSQTSQSLDRVTITITADGKISLNQQAVSINALPEKLRAFMQNRQTLVAIINSDQSVDFGLAVAVMDQVRQVPGVRLAIATRKPE